MIRGSSWPASLTMPMFVTVRRWGSADGDQVRPLVRDMAGQRGLVAPWRQPADRTSNAAGSPSPSRRRTRSGRACRGTDQSPRKPRPVAAARERRHRAGIPDREGEGTPRRFDLPGKRQCAPTKPRRQHRDRMAIAGLGLVHHQDDTPAGGSLGEHLVRKGLHDLVTDHERLVVRLRVVLTVKHTDCAKPSASNDSIPASPRKKDC